VRYDPDVDVWHPLRPVEAAALLRDCGARWWLSGGCGIDAWLGRATREHGDIDVSVLRADWPVLAAALPARLGPFAAVDGELSPLPGGPAPGAVHNIWIRDAGSGSWVLQVNLEEGDERVWRYRRDPSVSRAWSRAVESVGDLPVGNPAVQLLWKATAPAPEDAADLAAVLPALTSEDLAWLAGAVARAHPDSPWRALLDQAAGGGAHDGPERCIRGLPG
jgi:hypothetical protein